MELRLTSDDEKLLLSLVEYRVLSASHLAVLHQRNAAALRRRLGRLNEEGLIQVFRRALALNQGRPENIVSVSRSGLELLQTSGRVDRAVSYDAVVPKPQSLEHELLISEFRVQTVEMERFDPNLHVRFLAGTAHQLGSQAHQPHGDVPLPADRISRHELEFVPDGVLAVTHHKAGKKVLFFLEADRGTEPTNSGLPRRGIQSKIACYRTYFQSQTYKRHEQVFSCELRGFRVLFVAEGEARTASLCRAVWAMHPCDFVWLTSRERMAARGVWAPIWVKGGRLDQPLESILGTKAPDPCPAPRSGQPASQNSCSAGSSQPQPR